MLTLCWAKVGPALQTVVQLLVNIGPTYCALWEAITGGTTSCYPILIWCWANVEHWINIGSSSVLLNCQFSQQTQNICITFVERWPNVFDVGPTLYKCYTNVMLYKFLCLLGRLRFTSTSGGGCMAPLVWYIVMMDSRHQSAVWTNIRQNTNISTEIVI